MEGVEGMEGGGGGAGDGGQRGGGSAAYSRNSAAVTSFGRRTSNLHACPLMLSGSSPSARRLGWQSVAGSSSLAASRKPTPHASCAGVRWCASSTPADACAPGREGGCV